MNCSYIVFVFSTLQIYHHLGTKERNLITECLLISLKNIHELRQSFKSIVSETVILQYE